eukprot:scaffold139096_cov32-Prasinocladus_malaysianus.AAC.1
MSAQHLPTPAFLSTSSPTTKRRNSTRRASYYDYDFEYDDHLGGTGTLGGCTPKAQVHSARAPQ